MLVAPGAVSGNFGSEWMQGTGGTWYYIVPDGRLYRWLGSTLANDPQVDVLDSAAGHPRTEYLTPNCCFHAEEYRAAHRAGLSLSRGCGRVRSRPAHSCSGRAPSVSTS